MLSERLRFCSPEDGILYKQFLQSQLWLLAFDKSETFLSLVPRNLMMCLALARACDMAVTYELFSVTRICRHSSHVDFPGMDPW